MKENIPRDILNSIVSEVAYGAGSNPQPSGQDDVKALCLVSKSCVPACQDALFNTITLQSDKIVEGGEVLDVSNYTSRFAALIAGSPHIGTYVRSLTYRIMEWDASDIAKPEVSFALEQLRSVVELKLIIDEAPRESRMFWSSTCFKMFGVDHFHHFPRHAHAVQAIMELPTLQYLTLRGIEMPSSIMLKLTGLECLDLQRSCIVPLRGQEAEGSGRPIRLKILKLDADASNFILAVILRTLWSPSRFGISFTYLEKLSIAVGPPVDDDDDQDEDDDEEQQQQPAYATSDVLRRTMALKELHLYDYFPVPSTLAYSTSPLQDLHRASRITLKKLSYNIRMSMGAEDTSIQDIYHSFLKDGALTVLTNLEELDISVWIGGHVYALEVDARLREALGELDTVLGQGLASSLTKVRLAIALSTELTASWAVRELKDKVETGVYEMAFPQLRERARQGALNFTLEAELDRSGDASSDEDEDEEELAEDESEEESTEE